MNRKNIDWGIDLAATNSTVAVLGKHGTHEDRRLRASLKAELVAAMDSPPEDLPKKVAEVSQLRIRLPREQSWWWVGLNDYLKAQRTEMTNQDLANKWFAHAEKAIANGNVEALKSACRQLWALLPAEEQRRGYGGTATAAKDAVYETSSV